MEKQSPKKPEIEPVPQTNPAEPGLPEVLPEPEKKEPVPKPEIEPLPMPEPEIEPVK